MEPDIQSLRRAAAEAGRSYLANSLTWEQFMQRFSDCDDDLVGNLVTLIEHEPKRGGFLGVNEKRWAQYQSQVASALTALES
jgi:hypothetical protein